MSLATLPSKLCLPSLCVRSWDVQDRTPHNNESEHIEDVYDFEHGRELGAGGFGIVRKAIQRQTNEVHAIKSITKAAFKSHDLVRHEINILGQLHHPCICPLIDTFEDRKQIHIVLEYIDGHELFKEIAEQGVLNEARAVSIIQQVFSALQHCHEKHIIHRDVKPENIMVYRKQDRADMTNTNAPMVKLIDFGLATWYEHEEAAEAVPEEADHCRMGCFHYLAPEARRGCAIPASDVFSAGVVLQLMLTGVLPNEDGIVGRQCLVEGSSWAAVSSSVRDLARQVLRTDPLERITAEEAAEFKWNQTRQSISQPQVTSKTHIMVCNSLTHHDDLQTWALIAKVSSLLKTWCVESTSGKEVVDLMIDIMSFPFAGVGSRTESFFFDAAWTVSEAWMAGMKHDGAYWSDQAMNWIIELLDGHAKQEFRHMVGRSASPR